MNTFSKYYSIITESLSKIVWHYTNNPLKILKTDRIHLSSEIGPNVTKRGKAFYLSTARSKTGSYSDSSNGTIFKLDGNKLNQSYSGAPVEYWSGFSRRTSGKSEMEDRLYSNEPVIENFSKYILEIQCWINGDKKSLINSQLIYNLKKLEDIANSKGIPIKFFRSYKDFIMNKNPSNKIFDIVDEASLGEPYEYKSKFHRYKSKEYKQLLNFLLYLKDPDHLYDRYDSMKVLINQYNNISTSHDNLSIQSKKIIARMLKQLKLRNVENLISLRFSQYSEIDRNLNLIPYFRRLYKEIIDRFEDDDYDPFNTFYDISRYFEEDKNEIKPLRQMTNLFNAKNAKGLKELFERQIHKFEQKNKEIMSTIYSGVLKSLDRNKS